MANNSLRGNVRFGVTGTPSKYTGTYEFRHLMLRKIKPPAARPSCSGLENTTSHAATVGLQAMCARVQQTPCGYGGSVLGTGNAEIVVGNNSVIERSSAYAGGPSNPQTRVLDNNVMARNLKRRFLEVAVAVFSRPSEVCRGE